MWRKIAGVVLFFVFAVAALKYLRQPLGDYLAKEFRTAVDKSKPIHPPANPVEISHQQESHSAENTPAPKEWNPASGTLPPGMSGGEKRLKY